MAVSPTAGLPGRKAQALAFIETFLTTKGHSPTIGEIAAALGVSDTRVKALVHQLANDRSIVRAPGAQRGISVPGLSRRMEIEQAKALLRAAGMKVDEDFVAAGAFPKGHLPLVAIIEHIPTSGSSEAGNDGTGNTKRSRPGRGRTAARRAPGARTATPDAAQSPTA